MRHVLPTLFGVLVSCGCGCFLVDVWENPNTPFNAKLGISSFILAGFVVMLAVAPSTKTTDEAKQDANP